MSARDLIQEALHSLEANKGRSLLTIPVSYTHLTLPTKA